jgi:hypothetical protein
MEREDGENDDEAKADELEEDEEDTEFEALDAGKERFFDLEPAEGLRKESPNKSSKTAKTQKTGLR